jgi:predicted lipoprotein with Yx(FWY)xxD motif
MKGRKTSITTNILSLGLIAVVVVVAGCSSKAATTTATTTAVTTTSTTTTTAPTSTVTTTTTTTTSTQPPTTTTTSPPTTTSSTPTTTTTSPPTTTTTTSPYTVNVSSKAGLGTFLVDNKGLTLYWTTSDAVGVSNITGATLVAWPLFYVSNFNLPSSLKASDFGSIMRADESLQVTYKGYPLYYYSGDKVAGDTTGQGKGNIWFIVNPGATAPANLPPTTS